MSPFEPVPKQVQSLGDLLENIPGAWAADSVDESQIAQNGVDLLLDVAAVGAECLAAGDVVG